MILSFTDDQINEILTFANSQKNIKKYVAVISGNGESPPVVTVLENTVGNIVWTWIETNHVRGTLSGAFLENKIWFISSNDYWNVLNSDLYSIPYIGRNSDNAIDIYASTGPAYGNVWRTNIEIRVYP